MRADSTREPSSENVEGAPTLVYEVWDWIDSDPHWRPLAQEKCHWRFLGYRTLSLRQMLKYAEFGYHVERSNRSDRSGTLPLFPRLDPSGPGSRDRLDPVPVPEPGPSGG